MPLRVSSLIIYQPKTTTTPQLTNNNLELICRTCLKDCATWWGIFNHRRDNMLLADMLVNCTSLELHEEDGFPVNICNKCMEKLTCAFDFKTMVIESDIKLKELRQDDEVKKERELCNDDDDDDVENILVNEEVLIKIEETTITDLGCKNENTLRNQTNKEEIKVDVRLEFESLEGIDCFFNDFGEATRSSEDSTETINFEKIKEIGSVADLHCESEDALGNQAGKGGARLEFESFDENGDVSNDSVEAATSNSGNPSEMKAPTTPAAKEERTQSYYDEKNAELLNNPDFNRIMIGGLNNEKKQNETVFCPECNKTYSYKHYIEEHAYIHTGKRPYKCDKCEKRFPREATLRAHMGSHKFSCDVCGKSFFKEEDVKRHKAAKHSVKTVHKCDVCDRIFKTSSRLASHSMIHAKKKKNFVCTTCGKVLSRKGNLDSHMKIHRSDNQHICKYCGKYYVHGGALKVHIQIHSTNSFACEVCGKTYSKRCLVNRHMTVHTIGTPHACELCPSSFKYRNSLLKHMRNRHKKKEVQKDA